VIEVDAVPEIDEAAKKMREKEMAEELAREEMKATLTLRRGSYEERMVMLEEAFKEQREVDIADFTAQVVSKQKGKKPSPNIKKAQIKKLLGKKRFEDSDFTLPHRVGLRWTK